jgi:hypothetical protein
MKSFLKHSIAAVLFGAMGIMAASVYAMPVAKSEDGATLSIGGAVFSRFGQYSPGGGYGSPDAPAAMTAYGEGIVNVNATNAGGDLSAIIELRVRTGGGQVGANAGNHYITGAQTQWRPIENLQIDVGLIPYRPWEERITQWNNYTGFRPVPQGNDYLWFPENKRGADITYAIPGDMRIEAGVWLPVDAPNYNSDGAANQASMWSGGAGTNTSDAAEVPIVTMAYVPHLQITGSNWMFSALYGSETLEASGDGWANSEESVNTGFAVVGRYNYMEGSFAKLGVVSAAHDKFNAYGAPADETHMTMAVAVEQLIGAPYSVYVEYASTENANGVKDSNNTWMAIGFKKSLSSGGRVQVIYESNDSESAAGDPDADTFIGVGFAQPY